jgi:drug/metabolite transporter (DMT)-like permease
MAGKRTPPAGITAALASAFFLGLAPIFGKQAMQLGLPWQAVVAIRTAAAALLLLAALLAFRRRFLYIYPAGLLGCLLAGGINGIGSLFYYSALSRIDAGLGQLLYALYPLFVALWLWLDRQPPGRLTLFRLGLVVPAVLLLTQAGPTRLEPLGIFQMLAAAALYALHLPINQRVLYEMPAPTVTLYTLAAMTGVVLAASFLLPPARLSAGAPVWETLPPGVLQAAALPLAGMTLVTFLSRLALFAGVKRLGGMQTALLGLGELLVTLVLAHLLLGERFTLLQWCGAALLAASLALVAVEKPAARRSQPGRLGTPG